MPAARARLSLGADEGPVVGGGVPGGEHLLCRRPHWYPQRDRGPFREIREGRWSLLVLREISFGVHRFTDIQVNTGAPREALALRLRKLEEAGVIERRQYSDHPPRDEYLLTPAGRELTPVLTALREWGERHVTPDGR